MARLILKSPYIKGGARAVNYAKYIGTHERVELVPDGRHATKKQEQLITDMVKDFPDAKKLPEYSEYHNRPTKVNASVFITQALEDNWDGVQQSDIYAEYIATRPRVERLGSHGLFGDEDYVDLKKVTAELEHCEKNVWTHIVSLKREDAARLGYDNAKSWRNLLRAHHNDIAAAMNIPGKRRILLPQSTADILRERQKAAPSEWIFFDPLRPERPVSPDAAYRQLKTLLSKAGITESIPFHGLRHTFATHALASGVDAKTLSGILGHTDASFTLNTYTHVTTDMQEQASVIVGNFMEDIFGKELKPWQSGENAAKEAST